MSLLLLHPDILDYVRNLPEGTPERLVTEKKLRCLVRLPHETQVVLAHKQVSGFRAFKIKSAVAI
jgi:hypothetical protein